MNQEEERLSHKPLGITAIAIPLLTSIGLTAQVPQSASENTTSLSVPEGVIRLGDGDLFPKDALVVDKSVKRIYVVENIDGKIAIKQTFEADLGKMRGDKHSTGDSRTPEGIYFLNQMLQGPSLDPYKYGVRAFVTDYPNFFDRRDGKSGYGIWLHAIDDRQTLERGSSGCVVVRNDTIEKLTPYITLRETPLLIFDKVKWVASSEIASEQEDVLKAIGEWRQAWESKDMDQYLGFYSDDFRYLGMNLRQFRRFKQNLADKYGDIHVHISMPVIYAHNDYWVARFFQDYKSPDHSDFGEKTLYMLRTNNQFKILDEEWHEAPDVKTRAFASIARFCCDIKTEAKND